jgi:hypothetical protein
MRKRIGTALMILALMMLALPLSALAQNRGGRCDTRNLVRRDRNGVRFGDARIGLLEGPGLINYEYKHRWMEGAGGAATVIGIGAGAGAVTGTVLSENKKKGAVIGAIVGAGAATGLWLYKNRTERRRIF